MWNLSQTKINNCYFKLSFKNDLEENRIKNWFERWFSHLLYLLRSCTFGWPKGSWKCPKRLPRSPLHSRLLQFGHSERNQTTHEKNCHRLDAWSHRGREMQVKIVLSKSFSYSIISLFDQKWARTMNYFCLLRYFHLF